jgi:hypothetical protein
MLPQNPRLARLIQGANWFCRQFRRIFAVYHLPSNCIYIIIQALRALAELINLESHEGD